MKKWGFICKTWHILCSNWNFSGLNKLYTRWYSSKIYVPVQRISRNQQVMLHTPLQVMLYLIDGRAVAIFRIQQEVNLQPAATSLMCGAQKKNAGKTPIQKILKKPGPWNVKCVWYVHDRLQDILDLIAMATFDKIANQRRLYWNTYNAHLFQLPCHWQCLKHIKIHNWQVALTKDWMILLSSPINLRSWILWNRV